MPNSRLAIGLICIALSSGVALAQGAARQTVYWPSKLVSTTGNLRITELRVSLACGEVKARKNIPSDWNMEVIRPISARSELHFSAGHGASDIPSLKELDGVIVIGDVDKACFEISAQIVTETSEISISKKELQVVATESGG